MSYDRMMETQSLKLPSTGKALKGDHSFMLPIEWARSLEENTHLKLASSFTSFSLLLLFSLFLKPVLFAFCTYVSINNLIQ